MNTLEYIDKQILFVKQNIQYHKDLLTTAEDDESIEIIKSTIRLLEPDLQTLQQIKAELEAWEEIKKYIIVKEGCVPLYDSIYEYIELENDCIDESNSEGEGISIMIIKKALEVKE